MRRDCAHWGRARLALAPAPAGASELARHRGLVSGSGPGRTTGTAAEPATPITGIRRPGWRYRAFAGTGRGCGRYAVEGYRWPSDPPGCRRAARAGPSGQGGRGRRGPCRRGAGGASGAVRGQGRRFSTAVAARRARHRAPRPALGGGGAPAPGRLVGRLLQWWQKGGQRPVLGGHRRPPARLFRCRVVPATSRVIGHQPVSSTASTGATEATTWPASRVATRTPVASRPWLEISRTAIRTITPD